MLINYRHVSPRAQKNLKPIVLDNFNLGLNTSLSAAAIQPNEMSSCVNFKLLPLGGLQIREGLTRYTTSALTERISFFTFFPFDIDLSALRIFEDTTDREWENSAGREWAIEVPASSGTDELIVTQPDNKLYLLNSLKAPVEQATLEGDATIIPFGDKAIICDGSFLKYWDKNTNTVLMAYDDGSGDDGYQYDKTALTPDTMIKLYSGGNTKAGVSFETQDWDSSHTITITTVEIYALKSGSPTGNVGCELYLDSDDSLVATSDTVYSAADIGTVSEKLTFTFDSGAMSPLTIYNAVLTYAGDPLGDEKVIDGSFTGASQWLWGTGWAFDDVNNEADATASSADLEQDISAVAGETYKLVFTVLNYSSGTITPQIGGVNGTAVTADETYSQYIDATTTGYLKFQGTAITGSVSNASVKKVTLGSEIIIDGEFEVVNKALAKGVAGITKANPGVVSFDSGHGYANNDVIYFSGLTEMTELNDKYWVLRNNAADTFELQTTVGNSLDTSGYAAAETTGGDCAQLCSHVYWIDGAGVYPSVDGAGALGNKADFVEMSADLEQDISAVSGGTYKVIYTVSGYSIGSCTPKIGAAEGTAVTANGTYTEYIDSIDTGNFMFRGVGFTGKVDTVSVKLLSLGSEKVVDGGFTGNSQWTWGAGWVLDDPNNEADATTSNASLEQDVSAIAGETYRVVYTVKNFSGGTVQPQIGGVNGTSVNANETYTEDILAVGTGNLKFTGTNFTGTIDTISVKKIENYIQLECDTVTASGDAKYYDGSWSDDALKIAVVGVKPGRPPSAMFGLVQANRIYLSGDPFNPGVLWYSNLNTIFDWSTADGGGWIGIIDDNVINFPAGALVSLFGSIYIFGQHSQPYLCQLTGSDPTDYAISPIFQKIYATHKTAIHTVNDLWFGNNSGINALSGVEQFGDLRTENESDAIDDRIRSYWDDERSFSGYNSATGQYFLKLHGYARVLVVHTKNPVLNQGKVRYPWTEYLYVKQDLLSSSYQWVESSTANEYYITTLSKIITEDGDYLITEDGSYLTGNFEVTEPPYLLFQDSVIDKSTVGSLADHEWGFGDNESLGYNTIYVRDDSGRPDTTDIKIYTVLEPTAFANYNNEFYVACDDGYIYKMDQSVEQDNSLDVPCVLGGKLFESPYNEVCLEKYDVSCGTSATGATLDFEIYELDLDIDELHSASTSASFSVTINSDFNRNLNYNVKKFLPILRNFSLDGEPLRINNISLLLRSLSQ